MSNTNADFSVKSEYIHRGGWTNWNGDFTTGGEITVTKSAADLLNIFIGIFFVFMESGLWSLICFALFLYRRWLNLETVGDPPTDRVRGRDAIWHQKQAILRNAGDDFSVGLSYFELWCAYGWSKSAVIWRTWPTILAALLSFTSFLVALPFVISYLLLDSQGNEVLIQSPNCGWWEASFQNDKAVASREVTNRTREAVQYADNCYESDEPSDLCDNFLMKRKLKWTRWHNTACPFGEGICLGDNTFPAFQMETMLLDSHEDFGMNAPKNDRFALQKTTTCVPLDVQTWSEVVDGTLNGENITQVYFGATSSSQYTYSVSNLQFIAGPDYKLAAYTSYASEDPASKTFSPIKQLQRTDADISVIFLNNNMIPVTGLYGPCRDPFFSATKRQLEASPGYYLPDNPITAIGCADQYAFHNPVTGKWSNQTGMMQLGNDITKDWGLTAKQVAAMSSLRWILGNAGATGTPIQVIGSDALRARKFPGVFNNFQNPLPDDQWKNEVGYWFNIGLATLQLKFISISTGPQNQDGMENVLPALSEGTRHDYESIICNSQKIHNNSFKNFHRAGFIALAAIGGLLVFMPYIFIKSALAWGHRYKKAFVLEWVSYGQLQMLRMANEGINIEGWQDCGGEIPSLAGKNIGSVDASLTMHGKPHPRLRQPRSDVEIPRAEVWNNPGV
ncbi:Fc.00g045460.m01.CDS01 [Cosmosporella sp. VM-42]